jgi:hypothetical protein
MILDKKPIMLKDVGAWKEPDSAMESETFKLDREKWRNTFADGLQLKNTSGVKNQVYVSGVYCFWWKGKAKELIALQGKEKTHYVQGQECSPTDHRFQNSRIICKKIGKRKSTRKGKEIVKDIHHAFHPVVWNFKEVTIGKETYIPLYVGKATQIYYRVKQHLSWPGRKKEVIKEKYGFPMALKPEKNTVAQFRAGYEYLTQSMSDTERRKLFKKKIGISMISLDFEDFQERFYLEDCLIGHLRPPFNVDSER